MSNPAKTERVVLQIIQLGVDRCGAGFGKYPLGVWDAVQELLVLVPDSVEVSASVKAFRERLDR
jgi:hypothetical protein